MKFCIQSSKDIPFDGSDVTIIAPPSRASELFDRIGLCGENRQLSDHFLETGEKSWTLYRMHGASCCRLSVVIIPPVSSPHLPTQNVFALRKSLKNEHYKGSKPLFLLAIQPHDDVFADGYAGMTAEILRAQPLYCAKTDKNDDTNACVDIVLADELDDASLRRLNALAEMMPDMARLVDMPALELNTETFSEIVRDYAWKNNLSYQEIVGEELQNAGFGGIYHVGKSGVKPPRLCVIHYKPQQSRRRIILVGKGIVYDTGGLCLKPREHMATMKSDMAGAAAVLGAVLMASKTALDCEVMGVLCLAENGIGPNALRPDDIIRMHSGLTVEINNTDAEGRLVLADGVSFASRQENVDLIIDIATLTGAQLMCTGKNHAGLLCGDEKLTRDIFEASLSCGEPVFPLLYAPELLMDEFKSQVADMKNSVKDRMNAQTSCAGHFVEKHLDSHYHGHFAHIDIAGPAFDNDRATGYGVLLLDRLSRL